MESFFAIDWARIFMPELPLLEIFVRGTCTYLMLFAFLRLIKRQAGAIGISDLLVVVLIADASQNAMASEYTSIADGLILVATIIFWNVAFEYLGFHFKFFERLVHAAPLPLIKNGRIMQANMRSEFITREELMSQLRLQGIEHIGDVKKACLEGDGKISVVPYDGKHQGARDSKVV